MTEKTWSHNWEKNGMVFTAPYFQMLVRGRNGNGRLPEFEIGAHALWHYYLVAANAFKRFNENLVYEGDKSVSWNPRPIFEGIAMLHGISVKEMGRYWEVVRQQRMALGLSSNADLPTQFQFKE